jgi:hypothetical protein
MTLRQKTTAIVLLGWGLGGFRADELLPVLRTICPDAYVVALEAGADAFVSKTDPLVHLGLNNHLV